MSEQGGVGMGEEWSAQGERETERHREGARERALVLRFVGPC